MKKKKATDKVAGKLSAEEVAELFEISEKLERMSCDDVAFVGEKLITGEVIYEGEWLPKGWSTWNGAKQNEWFSQLRRLVKLSIGEKGLLRYHLKNNRGFTDQQFEDWWLTARRVILLGEIEDKISEQVEEETCQETEERDDEGNYRIPLIFALVSFILGYFFSKLFF